MIDHFCGKCGYDLSGCSSMGTCPECNTFFNKQSGENIRGSESHRTTRGVSLAWGFALILIAMLILTCGGIIAYMTGRGKLLAVMAVVAFVFILAAAVNLIRERAQP